MKRINLGLLLSASLLAVIFSCSNPETPKEESVKEALAPNENQMNKSRFPNDRSELAILMRNLNDELMMHKQAVKDGAAPQLDWVEKYAAIKTASPTDPKDSSVLFQAFADKFLLDLKNFQYADSSERVEVYNAMIQSCLDCHQEHCHGPMVAIRKLKI